jgi:hypothetical protein
MFFAFEGEKGREGRYVVSGCMVAFDGDEYLHAAVSLLFAGFLGKSGNHESPWRSEDRETNYERVC